MTIQVKVTKHLWRCLLCKELKVLITFDSVDGILQCTIQLKALRCCSISMAFFLLRSEDGSSLSL